MNVEAIGLLLTVITILLGIIGNHLRAEKRSKEKLHSRIDETTEHNKSEHIRIERKADTAIDMIKEHLIRHDERESK
jgi:hypothetical protein